MGAFRVFINPGHDRKKDSGAIHGSYRECDIAYDIGTRFRAKLDNAGGFITYLMQDDSLETVVEKANSRNCDIFISIHLNASENVYATGTETYFYLGSRAGAFLGSVLQRNVDEYFRSVCSGWVSRGVKTNDSFYVLRATYMPAVLVEVGFISNDSDLTYILAGVDGIATALCNGCLEYREVYQRNKYCIGY